MIKNNKDEVMKKLAELAFSRNREDFDALLEDEDIRPDPDYPDEADGESEPFVEVKGPVSSTNRDPTPAELAESTATRDKLKVLQAWEKEIQKLIKETKKACKHTVSVDEAGWTYDSRTCHGCGKDQGLV